MECCGHPGKNLLPVAVSSEVVLLHVAVAELADHHAVVHIVGALDDLRPKGAVREPASVKLSPQQTQRRWQHSTGTHKSELEPEHSNEEPASKAGPSLH